MLSHHLLWVHALYIIPLQGDNIWNHWKRDPDQSPIGVSANTVEFGESTINGKEEKVLRKTLTQSQAIEDYVGDIIMYNVLKELNIGGHYEFLKHGPDPDIKFTKPSSPIYYYRQFYKEKHTLNYRNEEKAKKLRTGLTDDNYRQLAIMVLVDLMVFNNDRTRLGYQRGSQWTIVSGDKINIGNIMAYKADDVQSILPIDNGWGHFIGIWWSSPNYQEHKKMWMNMVKWATHYPRRFAGYWLDDPENRHLLNLKPLAAEIFVKAWDDYGGGVVNIIENQMKEAIAHCYKVFGSNIEDERQLHVIQGLVNSNIYIWRMKHRQQAPAGAKIIHYADYVDEDRQYGGISSAKRQYPSVSEQNVDINIAYDNVLIGIVSVLLVILICLACVAIYLMVSAGCFILGESHANDWNIDKDEERN